MHSEASDSVEHNFTRTEVDVLTRIALGQSVPDIAKDLLTPVPEINIIVALICAMLDVDSRSAAVAEGFRRGIVTAQTIDAVREARRRSGATPRGSWFGARSHAPVIER